MMSGFLSRSVKFFLCEKELAISHAILSHESLGWGFVYYCCGVLWRKRLWLIFKVNRHAMMQNIVTSFVISPSLLMLLTGDVLLLCHLMLSSKSIKVP